MSEGARVTELMIALNWTPVLRVASDSGFAPNFPVEFERRGNTQAFTQLLSLLSELCEINREALEEYGPSDGRDLCDEEGLRTMLILWTEGIFGLPDEELSSSKLEAASCLALMKIQCQLIETLVSWGLRPRPPAQQAAVLIRELVELNGAVAGIGLPFSGVAAAWTLWLKPDSGAYEETLWVRAVAQELALLSD